MARTTHGYLTSLDTTVDVYCHIITNLIASILSRGASNPQPVTNPYNLNLSKLQCGLTSCADSKQRREAVHLSETATDENPSPHLLII